MRHPDRHGRALGDHHLCHRGGQDALGLAGLDDVVTEPLQIIRQAFDGGLNRPPGPDVRSGTSLALGDRNGWQGQHQIQYAV